ncbi:MAG: hypothetical protein IJU90_05465 [Bacteroidales bacterium]|nr:hypothetical protein [Bacteroidales bacterium]
MNRIFPILLLALLFFATSCKKESHDDAPNYVRGYLEDMQTADTYKPREFVSAVTSGRYAAEQTGGDATMSTLLSRGGDVALLTHKLRLDTIFSREADFFFALNLWEVVSVPFTYRTVSVTGQPIVLSARVTFPAARSRAAHNLSSISLYAHHFLSNQSLAPSCELSLLTLRILYNSAVVEPDFQGYGNTESEVFSDVSYKPLGRQMLDCEFAALEAMRSYGVYLADNGYTTLWGYSVAAPIVIGAMLYHDQQLPQYKRDAVRLHSAFVGSGPFLLDRMLQYFDLHPDYNAQAMDLVSLYTLPAEYYEGYKPEDLLPSWGRTYIVDVGGKTMTYNEAIRSDYSDGYGNLRPAFSPNDVLSNNFAEDMFNSDGHFNYDNEKTRILFRIMTSLTDWGSWQPNIDVYISHSNKDEYIPYSISNHFYTRMLPSGKMHWTDVPAVKLTDDSYHISAVLWATTAMILGETPAEAQRFLLSTNNK